MTQTLEQKLAAEIKEVRRAMLNDAPELGRLMREGEAKKYEAAELIKARIKERGAGKGISRYFTKLKINPSGNKHQAIENALPELRLNYVLDINGKYRQGPTPENRDVPIGHVRHALFHDIPELEQLLEDPDANREEAIALIRGRIDEQNITHYMFKILRLNFIREKAKCKVFNGSKYEAIRVSLPELKIDRVIDLGDEYRGWKKRDQAIANVRHALFHDIPELEVLEADPVANKERAAELIRGRIEESNGTKDYAAHLGIRTLETAKHCPHFEGSTYEAIRQSLDKFNFDVVFDLGSEYTGWRKPKQRRANIRHALFRDIPELKALEANPIANKERAAELLRGRIEEARGVNRYLAKTGLRSAARNIYGEKRGYDVVTQHLDFDLHPVFDLGLDFQGWANPDKAKANVREALFHDIPELKALEADPVANKEEAAELLKTKIEEAGGINPYFANIKIASAGLRAHCTAFGGSRYRAIQDSLPEFNFDLIDDLGNTSTLEWRISKLREIVRADHSQQEIRRIIVNEFGQGFNSLSKSYYAQAIAIVPESQQDYIRARRSNNELADVIEIHPRQRSRIDDIIPEIDRMHVIKLARDENGRSIPMDDYNTFICEVFGDEEFLVEALEEEGSEVIQYLRTRQIPNVATIEEVVDKGTKNPNYRMRMFLASNQEVTSNATLDSFVKFYSQEDKAIIAHEIAIANYLHTVVGLPSVGRARSVTLGAALSFDYDNSDGFTTVFKSSEPKRGAEEASYALVTPFVNITTLSEYLGERPSEKDETIQRVQDALIEFHTKGVENLGRINELSLPDRNALKYLTVENYREESHRFIRKQSGLETIYSEMGIAERLNTSAQKYTALTHGDCHPKNIVVSDEGEVVFLDFEYSRLGAAQIDEARVYAHRNMGLSMEQRLEYVRKGAQKKGINDVDEYVNAFHAAVIHTSLKHTRFVYEHAKQYGLTQAQEIIDKDISLIKEHAALISQPKDVDRLETEIRKEYNIDIYRIQGTA